MPSKPKHPCAFPGCPHLTDERYCEEHRAIARRKYNRFGRDEGASKRYDRNWRRIRDWYIEHHPLCEDCLEQQKYYPAAEVHHLVPLSQGGTNDVSNLRSLCRSCHYKRHMEIGDRRPFH